MGKQDHRGSLIHPQSHSRGLDTCPFLILEKEAYFQVFYMRSMLSRYLGKVEEIERLLSAR